MGLFAELLRREKVRHDRELGMKYMLNSMYGKFGSGRVWYSDSDSIVTDAAVEEPTFGFDVVLPKLYVFT